MTKETKGSRRQAIQSCGDGPKLDPHTQKHIGRMLKTLYDEVAREPVPDKFLDLLKQLEGREPLKR